MLQKSRPFPAALAICPDEVHVVRFASTTDAAPESAVSLLDPDERARAARLRRESDRQLFVWAHWTTRIVLARCLRMPPETVRFRCGACGKPEVANAPIDLRFNLAHAGDRGMIAVTRGREVGIDLEKEEALDVLTIAREFFSPAEQAAIAAKPPGERLPAFYRCWTRKESFVKAIGDGLTRPLSGFDVSVEATDAECLLACREPADDASRWTTIALNADPGYHAALTVQGRGWRLVEWDSVAGHIS